MKQDKRLIPLELCINHLLECECEWNQKTNIFNTEKLIILQIKMTKLYKTVYSIYIYWYIF